MIDNHLNHLPDLRAFDVLQRIGKGGFAEVYLARQKHLERLVAIKILRNRLNAAEQFASFRQEARLIAQLEHPHIVRVLDFGIVEQTPYLVMNYAPGGTLRRHIPRNSCLPLAQVVTYISQIAEALQYAHQKQIVHRDIKPENILLGQHGQLLLSDFGIAILTQNLSSEQQHVAGTAAYMAPEQIQRQPEPASDQYALAVMAYEWLCGSLPFTGTSIQVMMQHLSVPPPPFPVSLAIPRDVEWVICKALEKHPTERFSSAQAFADALQEASALPASASVSMPEQHDQDQTEAHLETTAIDVGTAVMASALRLSSSKSVQHATIFPLPQRTFKQRRSLLLVAMCAFPLVIVLPAVLGGDTFYAYLSNNQLPALCLLVWLLLIGPVMGGKFAPFILAFVYCIAFTPALIQGRITFFAAIGATLAQMAITMGAGFIQERKTSYHFLSSLALAFVVQALSITANSLIFQTLLICPFISISFAYPISYAFLPAVSLLLSASLERILILYVPSLLHSRVSHLNEQQKSDLYDQQTQ